MDIITDTRNPILHKKCEDLLEFNSNIVRFLNDMAITMKANSGWGLASPQVGISLNAFVMMKLSGEILKVVNPEIIKYGKIVTSRNEGCLSIPGKVFKIKRSKKITVKFKNENGDDIKMELRNFEAFVFQHEFDHLQGILISN